MKLALVTRRYPPLIGGAEKVLSYLAPALAAEGAEVTVLTAQPIGLGLPPIEHCTTAKGELTVARLPTSRVRFLGTWLYASHLRRWLRSHPIDLAYVSMLKHDAYVAVGVGRERGFPVVLRPEGAGATGDIAWQSWGRFGRTIARRCRQADAVVSISSPITEELRQDGYDPDRIHALPNGVPVPETCWQRRDHWREAPRAVFVGRLAPEKGLDTLVRAWSNVRASWPTARLTLVGEGPERAGLESQVAALGLSDAVEFAGAVTDPTAALRAADLFVLPSREEGMSIALLEAMALGLPLIASSVPGNRRIVQDFKHGRFVSPNDPEALAAVILDQWQNFDRAVQMGRTARSRVRNEFSIAAVARRHMALFRQLIAEQGARS